MHELRKTPATKPHEIEDISCNKCRKICKTRSTYWTVGEHWIHYKCEKLNPEQITSIEATTTADYIPIIRCNCSASMLFSLFRFIWLPLHVAAWMMSSIPVISLSTNSVSFLPLRRTSYNCWCSNIWAIKDSRKYLLWKPPRKHKVLTLQIELDVPRMLLVWCVMSFLYLAIDPLVAIAISSC
jgi:hypothetical protein